MVVMIKTSRQDDVSAKCDPIAAISAWLVLVIVRFSSFTFTFTHSYRLGLHDTLLDVAILYYSINMQDLHGTMLIQTLWGGVMGYICNG